MLKNTWKKHLVPGIIKRRLFKNVFEGLQDEFIDTFGVDKEYSEYLRKKVEIELLRIRIQHTGDRSLEFMIDVIEAELKAYDNKEDGGNFNQGPITIEKYMGFKIDLKTTSTFEYYSYIKSYELVVKEANKKKD